MRLWQNPEVKHLTFLFALFSAFAFILCFVISIPVTGRSAKTMQDERAALMAAVSAYYPEAEAQAASILSNPDTEQISAGKHILEKYGFGEESPAETSEVLRSFIPYGIVILFVILISFLLLLYFFRMQFSRIQQLTDYARLLRKQEYSMDIRDNDEGAMSIYKNEIYKVTVMLKEQAEHLRQDKRMLSNTLYDISHQLKTPLTSLFMLTDLLRDQIIRKNTQQYEFVAKIRAQLGRIEWLVTSLLKLSRLDADAVTLRNEPVQVGNLIQKAAEPLMIPIELKEQTLRIQGPSEVTVHVDENWTAEAIGNVLKNCMEHTPKGGKIHVEYLQNRLYTEIKIVDTGNGIAKEDIVHIFERFYRGKHAAQDSVGIGLAMAKSIIEKQNGSIRASNREKGAEFTIRFYRGVM